MKDPSAAARPYRCPDLPPAPVDAVRTELAGALEHGNAVLSAPPGAGKSSRVPLWLLEAPWLEGRKILLLEPRRVAARALARYAARLLGEDAGQTVGYRMRQESAVSARTRLEIVTEGAVRVWEKGIAYAVGDVVAFPKAGGAPYTCIQAHTSQEGWKPPAISALWAPASEGGQEDPPVTEAET